MKPIAYICAFLWIMATAWAVWKSYGIASLLFLGRTKVGAWWLELFGWLAMKIDER